MPLSDANRRHLRHYNASFRNRYYCKPSIRPWQEITLLQGVLTDYRRTTLKYVLFAIQKNVVFWDFTPCGYCMNRTFEGILSVIWLLVTANVPSSLIFVTLIMEAIRFSETSALTRVTRRNIPGDGILHSHRIALTGRVDFVPEM
jgi:hypothetical protein